MFGENFVIYFSQIAKNALKLSTMVGEIFEIYPWLDNFFNLLISTQRGD